MNTEVVSLKEYYQKILVHYNCNLFTSKNNKNLIKINKKARAKEIFSFYSDLVEFINNIDEEETVFYLPHRKGTRRLIALLKEKGVNLEENKLIPGSFTNPFNSNFKKDPNYLFLNGEKYFSLIKEIQEVKGRAFYLKLLNSKNTCNLKNKDNCLYNHRSLKSILIFFYLFLNLKKKTNYSFSEYVNLLDKKDFFKKKNSFVLLEDSQEYFKLQ